MSNTICVELKMEKFFFSSRFSTEKEALMMMEYHHKQHLHRRHYKTTATPVEFFFKYHIFMMVAKGERGDKFLGWNCKVEVEDERKHHSPGSYFIYDFFFLTFYCCCCSSFRYIFMLSWNFFYCLLENLLFFPYMV